jgi:anion-transporting  ArsA/GET3 family ATPase
VAAVLAHLAAGSGLSVLLVELEGNPNLAVAFGHNSPLGYEEQDLASIGPGQVRGRRLTPDDALVEYLDDRGLGRISRRLISSGVVEVVATAIPGLRDVLVLGKLKEIERTSPVDLMVVDAPATGHAMTFLTSSTGLADAVRSGPIQTQASEVIALLTDPARCRVVLVTQPEEMPINETIQTARRLDGLVGMTLAPVVVNGYLPELPSLDRDPADAAREVGLRLRKPQVEALRAAADLRSHRHFLQSAQLSRLAEDLSLPHLLIPLLFEPSIGLPELAKLARSLGAGIEALNEPGTDSMSAGQ